MWHYKITNHKWGKIVEDSINSPLPFKGYRTNKEALKFGKLSFEQGKYSFIEYDFEVYEVVEQHSMKLYLCTWGTNYGLNCCVVSALNEENAKELAIKDAFGWPDSIEANEIIPSDKEEVLKLDFYDHY